MKKGKGEGRTSSLNINKRGINMKKTLIVLLTAVLVMSMLFVSCSNEAKIDSSPVEVSFNVAQGRGLTSSIETHEVEDLYWYYKATRITGSSGDKFNYGEKTNWTSLGKGLSKPISLSQGKWDFSLQARKTQSSSGIVIYEGSVSGVLVLRNENSTVNKISVPVSQLTSGTGTILISKDIKVNKTTYTTIDTYTPTHVKYKSINTDIWSEDIPLSTETVEGVTSLSDTSLDDLVAGAYDVVVMYKGSETVDGNDVDIVFASAEITVTVYGNTTTTISGSINGITTSNQFTTQISGLASTTDISEADKSNAVPVSVPLTPQGEIGTETNVTFDAGTLPSNASNVNIEVKTVEEAQTGNFIGVDNNNAVVAAIDLKITDNSGNDLSVISGDGKKVTVTTYIMKNLSTVVVKYNGVGAQPGSIAITTSESTEEQTSNYYESDTGKLVFTTTHFSEFFVESNAVCYVKETLNGYSDLATAAASNANNTIVLLKDISVGQDNLLSIPEGDYTVNYYIKNLKSNLDGNGKTIIFNIPESIPGNIAFIYNAYGKTISNMSFEYKGKGSFIWEAIRIGVLDVIRFNNVRMFGEKKVAGNEGVFITYGSTPKTYFTDCISEVNVTGIGGSGDYNAIFVGYPMASYYEFNNCVNKGNLTCGKAAMFLGNATSSSIKLIIENCKNEGTIRSTFVDPRYKMNYYIAQRNKLSTLTLNETKYEKITDSTFGSIPTIEEDTLITGEGTAINGPLDTGMKLEKNDNNTFLITPATGGKIGTTNVAKYTVKIGIYVTVTGGTNRFYAAENVLVEESTSYITEMKDLQFVDAEFAGEADAREVNGNKIVTVGETDYYLVNPGESTGGRPKTASIYLLSAYDESGNLLASVSLTN